MARIGVGVQTSLTAGRFTHRAYDRGVGSDRVNEIGEDIVTSLKDITERLYERMPEGARDLRIDISYKL